jgi:hypothetical protein
MAFWDMAKSSKKPPEMAASQPVEKEWTGMTVFIAGRIEAIKQNKKSTQLRFISTDPDGGKRFDVLHLAEGSDVSQYYIGQEVNIPVTPFWNKKTNQVEFTLFDNAMGLLAMRVA